MAAFFLHPIRRLHAGLRQTEQVYMVLVAIAIGLLGGLNEDVLLVIGSEEAIHKLKFGGD